MQTMQEITTKHLHDATGKVVRAALGGKSFRVTLEGGRGVLIVPDNSEADASWAEIMKPVYAARTNRKEVRPNPILAERKKRNYATNLR